MPEAAKGLVLGISRRAAFVLLGAGLGFGLACGERFVRWLARPSRPTGRQQEGTPPEAGDPEEVGTLSWALRLLDRPREALFENWVAFLLVCRRNPGVDRLLHGCDLIMEHALGMGGAKGDEILYQTLIMLRGTGQAHRIRPVAGRLRTTEGFPKSRTVLGARR